VVGLALRRMMTCPIEINLLPPRYVREERFRRRQPALIAAMASALLTLGVWGMGVRQLTSLSSGRLTELGARLHDLKGVEAQLRQREDVINRHRAWLDRLLALPERATLWPQILADVRSRLLEGMWIVQFATLTGAEAAGGSPAAAGQELAPGGAPPTPEMQAAAREIKTIEITGYAYKDKVQQPDILKFRDRLRESPYFDETSDIAAMPQEGRDDFVREFTIRLVLKSPISL